MKSEQRQEDLLQAEFAPMWREATGTLAKLGLCVGAKVCDKDGRHFKVTTIEPKLYNFGTPKIGIVCHGVMVRKDGTWGTHHHWVGPLSELVIVG